MKGLSIFIPIQYGDYTGVSEHQLSPAGYDRLRSANPEFGRTEFSTRRSAGKHSFAAWFAAMMRHDFSLWGRGSESGSGHQPSTINPQAV